MAEIAWRKVVAPVTSALWGLAALFLAPNAEISFVSSTIQTSAPLWAPALVVGFLLGLWIAREMRHRIRHSRATERLLDAIFRPEPSFDDQARRLVNGADATVGLVQRRIQFDLGIENVAAVNFRDGGRDMNDRRAVKYVKVEIPGVMEMRASQVMEKLRDAYSAQLENLGVWLFSIEGDYVHGNRNVGNLRGLTL